MTVSTADLTVILNLSRQRINQLTTSKILNQISAGRYDQNQAITAYINYIRKDHDDESTPRIAELRARKMAVDAELSKTKLAAIRAEFIEVHLILNRDQKIKIAVDRGLSRLPMIADDMSGLSPAQMKNILTDCVRSILEELSDDQSELWK